ncbi:SET domain-containing protein [Favolaschia claudopus]|uniref:SET domain-containing protein n=1 Tax=Favolaschia claudopus TaxID=2862362 RepID=A0AAW0ED91_9AGAR
MSRTLSPAYACGCLNVRITPVPPGPAPSSAPPTELTAADGFRPVHVADEGIAVAHPQVTLRIRTRGELASRNRRARYTSLTCLICNVLVYRVHQIVSLDADGRDGPLMPTEDWVEQDILKSPTGWIEVHTQCLSGDAIARAEASPRYSAVFSVTVPAEPSPPTSPEPPAEDGPRTPFLAHLPPLFLPPPFTSAHPVFVYLANLAKDQSAHHRAAVEHEMEEIIRNKTAQLARTEAQLRHQVEILWRRFRDGLQSAEQMDASASVASPRSPRSPIPRSASASAQNGTPASPSPIPGTPVEVVRDFVPLPVVAPNRPVHAPAISSLSASLATSGFHHPRAQQQQQEQSSPARPASTISSSSRTLSGSSITLAGSPRMQPSNTAPARIFEEGSSVLQFGRKLNDTIDTAASYRYFQDVEADMARSKRERLDRARESENRSPLSAAAAAPAQSSNTESPRAGPSTANVNGNANGVDSGAHRRQNSQDAGSLGVRDKGKGKQRKVTFESQPAIVTIQRNVRAEQEEEARIARNTGEEMIFDLEPEGNNRESQEEGAIITLIEQPPQPRASQVRRTSRKPPTDSTGLPSSFMGLRPASLPAPSNHPPRRGLSPPEDSVKPVSEEEDVMSDADPEVVDEKLDSRDQEIRKLVAADNPSHRGRWKKNSAEWKTLVSSRGHSTEDDFDDDDLGPLPATHPNGSGQAGMPASMPISIRPLVNPRTVLSLASYRPQTMPPAPTQESESEPERPPVHPLPSSTSVRRAVYAERDLQRERDPGALDFAADADSVIQEESEEEREDDDNGTAAVGAEAAAVNNTSSETQEALRGGRERALRILQARNELPDSGMWRSLAT